MIREIRAEYSKYNDHIVQKPSRVVEHRVKPARKEVVDIKRDDKSDDNTELKEIKMPSFTAMVTKVRQHSEKSGNHIFNRRKDRQNYADSLQKIFDELLLAYKMAVANPEERNLIAVQIRNYLGDKMFADLITHKHINEIDLITRGKLEPFNKYLDQARNVLISSPLQASMALYINQAYPDIEIRIYDPFTESNTFLTNHTSGQVINQSFSEITPPNVSAEVGNHDINMIYLNSRYNVANMPTDIMRAVYGLKQSSSAPQRYVLLVSPVSLGQEFNTTDLFNISDRNMLRELLGHLDYNRRDVDTLVKEIRGKKILGGALDSHGNDDENPQYPTFKGYKSLYNDGYNVFNMTKLPANTPMEGFIKDVVEHQPDDLMTRFIVNIGTKGQPNPKWFIIPPVDSVLYNTLPVTNVIHQTNKGMVSAQFATVQKGRTVHFNEPGNFTVNAGKKWKTMAPGEYVPLHGPFDTLNDIDVKLSGLNIPEQAVHQSEQSEPDLHTNPGPEEKIAHDTLQQQEMEMEPSIQDVETKGDDIQSMTTGITIPQQLEGEQPQGPEQPQEQPGRFDEFDDMNFDIPKTPEHGRFDDIDFEDIQTPQQRHDEISNMLNQQTDLIVNQLRNINQKLARQNKKMDLTNLENIMFHTGRYLGTLQDTLAGGKRELLGYMYVILI